MDYVAENAFLRLQLTVSKRRSKRPRFRARDRFLLVTLSRMFSHWRDALVLVKPNTLLRWHHDGFRLLWKWRSRKKPPAPPRVPPGVVDLICRMATENRLPRGRMGAAASTASGDARLRDAGLFSPIAFWHLTTFIPPPPEHGRRPSQPARRRIGPAIRRERQR